MKKQFFSLVISIFFFYPFISCNNNDGVKLNNGPKVGRIDRSGNEKYLEILQKNLKYDQEIQTCRIYLRVKNKSNKLCSYSHFVASFFDSKGNLLGTGIGNGINIPAGREKTVDLIATELEMPSKYEIQIEDVTFE